MTGNGTVTLDPEQVIKLAEDIEAIAKKLRSISQEGFKFTNQPQEKTINISFDGVEWKVKGGGDATPDTAFAWAFAANKDGQVPEDKKQLVDYLKKFGKIQQNGYEVTISKDGKFLNRKKV